MLICRFAEGVHGQKRLGKTALEFRSPHNTSLLESQSLTCSTTK